MDIELTGIVGLTGPMGAGKSTVSKHFASLGIPVVDADLLVKEMYTDEMFCMDLNDEWGLEKGQDVKAQMAEMITQYPERLKRLEEICKPWLDRLIEEAITKARKDHPFVVFDAPLLYEGGWDKMCEYIILVQASEENRRERIMRRPGMTQAKMLILMDRQLKADDPKRKEDSGWIINTDGSIQETVEQANRIANSLRKFCV